MFLNCAVQVLRCMNRCILDISLDIVILVFFSSFAGGINALAAVTILDVINPMYTKRTGRRQIEPRKLALLFKGLGEHTVTSIVM